MVGYASARIRFYKAIIVIMRTYSLLIKKIMRDLFIVSLMTFIVYFFVDFFVKNGLVTNYINMNLFLLFVLGNGIVTILWPPER